MLVNRMVNAIRHPPQLNKPVVSISQDRKTAETSGRSMLVHVEGETSPTRFDTVFTTTTLAALQRMDLSEAGLHPGQRRAIDSLHYDGATKIAIRFTHAWWQGPHGSLYRGGEARTDLPLRVCVYPSLNPDSDDKPAVLLCSYTWARDAQRLAALVRDSSPAGEESLVELLLRNLAALHAGITYESLRAAYQTHYAFAWDHDPYAAGAFALFGPGQFRSLYPFLTRPAANGALHIAGEAASPVHGWVQGSLVSAYRAVQHFLGRYGMEEAMARLEAQWACGSDLEPGHRSLSHLQVYLARESHRQQNGV